MFQQMIIELLDQAALTEKRLGDEVGLSQASINRIKRGKQTDINYAAGKKLVDLHAAKCKTSIEKRA